jgi:hypothetical protein
VCKKRNERPLETNIFGKKLAEQGIAKERIRYYGRFIFKKEEQHAKKAHRQPVTRCRECGMEFLREEDRLHHVQQEKERKIDTRRHR